jgi:transcriptional regulator with XRE-family HTH domain
LIRTQRLALGMSQTALAEKLGVTFQQVQKYEKGANRVGSSRLVRIAHAPSNKTKSEEPEILGLIRNVGAANGRRSGRGRRHVSDGPKAA